MIREALNHLGKYRLLAGSVSAEVHRTPPGAAPDGGAVRRANAAAATTAAIAPGAVGGANAGRAYGPAVPEAGMGRDVLPRIHFLHQLSRERRRSDRSRAPLSIALFTFDGSASADVDALVKLVACNKRETDILGDLDHTTVSVLLPDTNEAGANRFVQKIMGQLDGSGFRTVTATYPDIVFDSLSATAPKFDDTQPLLIFDPVEEPARWQRIVKRVIDILGASAGLLVLSPLTRCLPGRGARHST